MMIDAATEAGSVFMSVEKVNKHRLPVELEDFCKHAREMGKATRRNEEKVAGFTPEEVEMIARRYIHCSAHWNAVELNPEGGLHGGAAATKIVGFVNRPDETGTERFTTWTENRDENT
jgi:hypothetical protein